MLPMPPSWRSEAFAEDLLGEPLAGQARDADFLDRASRWTTLLAPLLVVLMSVIAAVVPPLA